jgi:hypothetical protein
MALSRRKKMMTKRPTNEKVPFRLIHMPCCHVLICWVNPRRPNYCPECGKFIFRSFDKATWERTYSDAWLRVENDEKANYNPILNPEITDEMLEIVIDYHSEETGE